MSLWLKRAGNVLPVTKDETKTREAKRPEDWSPQEKLEAVMEAASVAEAEYGSWLRRRGLTSDHVQQWRETLTERAPEVFAPKRSRVSSAERKRVKELERELKRKDKALAETAALLVLQGKMQALWAGEDEPTEQKSDEQSSKVWRKHKPRERR